MWDPLKRWLTNKKPPARQPDSKRRCSVYLLGEELAIYVFAQARLADSWMIVTHAFVDSVSPKAGPEPVGRLVLRGLDAYNPAMPDAAGYAVVKTVPEAAGFKSWAHLDSSTRYCAVESDGTTVSITPYHRSPGGGSVPLENVT